MTKNHVNYCKSISNKCSDGSTIETQLKLINDKKKLLIVITFLPKTNLNFPLVLHWGISSNYKSSWILPTSCLFSSNGTTPEKCEDEISCETILSPSKDGINHSCEITLDICHLKFSHRETKVENGINGLENCENVISWLNYENREWGIKFVFYVGMNTCSNSQINSWIKDANGNSDFFIPLGEELSLFNFIEGIFIGDKLYKNYIENELKDQEICNSKCYLISQQNQNCKMNGLYHTLFKTNDKKRIPFVYLVSSKNEETSGSSGIFTVMIFINDINIKKECLKTYSNLMNEQYDIFLHFGLTKNIGNIFWNSPHDFLKRLNSDNSLIKNVDNESSEIMLTSEDGYSTCTLQFRKELFIHFKGIVFVIKLVPRNCSGSIEWIKSENNCDFLYEIPVLTGEVDNANSVLNLTPKDYTNKWKNKIKKFIDEKDKYKREMMNRYSASNESIITHRIFHLSEEMGLLYIISINHNSNCILFLKTISKRILVLHWGLLDSSIKGRKLGWKCPPSSCHPINSIKITDKALETELLLKEKTSEHIFEQELEIIIDKSTLELYNMFVCVFKGEDIYGNISWYKENNEDIEVPILPADTNRKWEGQWSEIIESIISAEVDWSSITLMHRYNLMDSIIQKWYREFKESDTYLKVFEFNEIIWSNKFEEESVFAEFNSKLVENKLITNLNLNVQEFWSWIMIWMRFNALGVLDWQRNYNTAPRLLAHSAENASLSVVSKWVELPNCRSQIRLIIKTIIRGGSRGQEVRDRILHIMHKNGIPEQHGTFYEQWHQKLHNNTTPDDVGICRSIIGFLRNNGNEEIFLRILKENGLSYEKISSYDRPITAKPFLPQGIDISTLICDFEQYLEVLIDVHDALDLQRSLHHSRQYMDTDLQNICASIVFGDIKKFDDTKDLLVLHRRLMTINDAREKILNSIYYSHGGSSDKYNKHAIKELLFLDLGLENLQGMFVQSICTIANNFNDITNLVFELNSFLWILFGHNPTNKELAAICFDWKSFVNNSSNLGNILLLRSILERIHIFIGNYLDETYRDWNPKVVFFAKNIGLNEGDPITNNFMDEILRSTLLSTISLQIKRINNYLLNNTQNNKLQDWQFISYNQQFNSEQKYVGIIKKVNRITDIKDEDEYPKIAICSYISGEEDIPMNVIGIILTNPDYSPDILSHLSVRARNMSVLLAVCQNQMILSNCIDQLVTDDICEIYITNGMRINIQKKDITKKDLLIIKSIPQTNVKQKSKLLEFKNKIRETNNSWILYPNEMDENKVGKKAINLVKLRMKLNSESQPLFSVPNCVSLPFGTLQKLSNSSLNDKIGKNIKLVEESDLDIEEVSHILTEIRDTIENELEPSTQLIDEINRAIRKLENDNLIEFGPSTLDCQLSKENLINMRNSKISRLMWKKIKSVWCSVYQVLAYNNMKKIGQSLSNVYMSIVIQKLINAKYAFVLHSKNPIRRISNPNGDKEDDYYDEMYGEIVIGLGETLVSNTCGKSLGFTSRRIKNNKNYKDDQFIVSFEITSFPSKSIGIFDNFSTLKDSKVPESTEVNNNYIFRSDSNAEDIEGFAGAGIFQSIPLFEPLSRYITYLDKPIISNENYRVKIIKRLATIAFYIQDEYNGIPQDIEGCIVEDPKSSPSKADFNVSIVQSRPQV